MRWSGGSSSSGPFGHSYSEPPTKRSNGTYGAAETAVKRNPPPALHTNARLPADQLSSHISLARARRTLARSGPLSTISMLVIGPEPPRLVQPTLPAGTPGTG